MNNVKYWSIKVYNKLIKIVKSPMDEYIRLFTFPKMYKVGRKYRVASVEQTIINLINTNNSLCRFGDGEIGWILNKNIFPKDVYSFEKGSSLLRKQLIKVLTSSNLKLDIGLSPLSEAYDSHYTHRSQQTLKLSMSKLGTKWMKYLDKNRQYYNTNVTRAYSGYQHYSYAKYLFSQLKKIWMNKKVLIVEGQGTRLGVKNDLFNNVKSIKRIECPSSDAFESYSKIKKHVVNYLRNNSVDLTLIALGPAATILASDLCDLNFRAIDVGHLDIEYEWFLRKKVCDIPYKRVNEVPGGQKIIPIHDKKYSSEIIDMIK